MSKCHDNILTFCLQVPCEEKKNKQAKSKPWSLLHSKESLITSVIFHPWQEVDAPSGWGMGALVGSPIGSSSNLIPSEGLPPILTSTGVKGGMNMSQSRKVRQAQGSILGYWDPYWNPNIPPWAVNSEPWTLITLHCHQSAEWLIRAI